MALFKHHPEVIETHQLTLSSAELRILWRCPVDGAASAPRPDDATESRHDDLRDPARTLRRG